MFAVRAPCNFSNPSDRTSSTKENLSFNNNVCFHSRSSSLFLIILCGVDGEYEFLFHLFKFPGDDYLARRNVEINLSLKIVGTLFHFENIFNVWLTGVYFRADFLLSKLERFFTFSNINSLKSDGIDQNIFFSVVRHVMLEEEA